ncbi:MAG: ATP-binding cassette domain-containing protein [Deltaproteobacteria bacterium]|nr:ATP-binding cassette domain-containing protein [Deltaproteobacteria bacterium]
MTSAYTLKDVAFAYGEEPVLRIAHLKIAAGEIVGLVGPNGSGKTTLLHLLAFLTTPQQGRLQFFGQTVQDRDNPSLRRKVGLLLQNPYLFHETVLANIIWGLRLRRVKKEEAKKTAREALDMVGLVGFEHRYAPSLSGGEAQRVALARCLALKPSVLLLDEPFNHMDREAVRLTEDLVVRLCQDHGTTVVFTSHAIEKLQAVAQRVVHLWQGRPVPTGPDNLFKGVLKNDGLVFDTGQISIRLENRVTQGDFIAIDPSGILLSLDGSVAEMMNTFSGRIVGLSDESGHVRVVVDVGERLVAFVKYEDQVLRSLKLGLTTQVAFGACDVSVL